MRQNMEQAENAVRIPGWIVLTAALLASACSNPRDLTAIERGRRMYMANCEVCHNPDPRQPGAAGPEIAGASRELLEARVVHGTYPPGYKPKRTTQAMLALPQLASSIEDLVAYLAAAQNGS